MASILLTLQSLVITLEDAMDEELRQNLKAENTWVRGFFMVLFLSGRPRIESAEPTAV